MILRTAADSVDCKAGLNICNFGVSNVADCPCLALFDGIVDILVVFCWTGFAEVAVRLVCDYDLKLLVARIYSCNTARVCKIIVIVLCGLVAYDAIFSSAECVYGNDFVSICACDAL